MVKHFIVIASAYLLGTRIALNYYDEDKIDSEKIERDIAYIKSKCGNDVPLSSHFVQTSDASWESVVQSDKFFEGIKVINTKEEFANILVKDRVLKGIDIAKYILTKVACTHLKLEKLTYMCYADFLCAQGKKLFEDKIYAYRFGPVVASVYEHFKKGTTNFADVEKDTITFKELARIMPFSSRIISAEDGLKKITSIDKTLARYGHLSVSELVSLTHQKSSPWFKAGAGSMLFQEIPDELIIKYHKYEEKEIL